MNCIPIINENDVVAPPPGMDQDLAGVRNSELNSTNVLLAIKQRT
jgi:hypothetical protein